jgi:hypothetical protein
VVRTICDELAAEIDGRSSGARGRPPPATPRPKEGGALLEVHVEGVAVDRASVQPWRLLGSKSGRGSRRSPRRCGRGTWACAGETARPSASPRCPSWANCPSPAARGLCGAKARQIQRFARSRCPTWALPSRPKNRTRPESPHAGG